MDERHRYMLCDTRLDGRVDPANQNSTLVAKDGWKRVAYGEGSKVGLLEALVVAPDSADGAGPGLLDCQDTLRLPLQLLALQALSCSSLRPERVPSMALKHQLLQR